MTDDPRQRQDSSLRPLLAVLSVAVAALIAAAVIAHPVEALTGAVAVLPITATLATWYIRHVYLSDKRTGRDGQPLRSTYLRRSWRVAAAITLACYPIAAVAVHSTLRRTQPELNLPALPPGVGATVIGVAILVALGTVHWKAIAIYRDRRRRDVNGGVEEYGAEDSSVGLGG